MLKDIDIEIFDDFTDELFWWFTDVWFNTVVGMAS